MRQNLDKMSKFDRWKILLMTELRVSIITGNRLCMRWDLALEQFAKRCSRWSGEILARARRCDHGAERHSRPEGLPARDAPAKQERSHGQNFPHLTPTTGYRFDQNALTPDSEEGTTKVTKQHEIRSPWGGMAFPKWCNKHGMKSHTLREISCVSWFQFLFSR